MADTTKADTTKADITNAEFVKLEQDCWSAAMKRGLRSGPVYNGGESNPLIWGDQAFGRGIAITGTVECPDALRIGQTNNALDVILVASHDTADKVRFEPEASVTLTMLVCDTPDGTFAAAGPTLCMVAPTEGIEAEADGILARFAIGNLSGKYAKVKLAFSGTAAGGTIDVALGYMVR